MRKKSILLVGAVVLVGVSLALPAAAAQPPIPSRSTSTLSGMTPAGPGGAVADDCASGAQARALGARAPQGRFVCLSQKRPGPPRIPPKARPDRHQTSLICPEGEWRVLRYKVCTVVPGIIVTWRQYCRQGVCQWVVVGTMDISATLSTFLSPGSAGWRVDAEIVAVADSGEGVEGSYLTGYAECEGACTPHRLQTPKQLLRKGKKVKLGGSVSSPPGAEGLWVFVIGKLRMTIEHAGKPAAPGEHTYRFDPPIRCDTVVSSVPGCVHPGAGIVFDVVGTLYESVAYHIQSAQISGLVGRDVPLHRTIDEDLVSDNRETSCPGTIPRPPLMQCDEYPFASTYEGAAKWGEIYGRTFDECAMNDYLPIGKTGPFGWSACFVPEEENLSAGADLGNFYFYNRVIDNDDFYVEVT